MADLACFGDSETSGDDSVSLTSTVVSDGDGKDYEVERILAEWETEGVIWYLTKWEGYPEVQATWQLKETFNRPEDGGYDVFKNWQETKMRVSRGYEKPYDIDDWEDRHEEAKRKDAHRKACRERRKAGLNRLIDALSSGSEAEAEKRDEEHESNLKARGSFAESGKKGETKPMTPRVTEPKLVKENWTEPEKQALMEGLRDADGPDWDKILANYGASGATNQLLRDKTMADMQEQLQTLREEFRQAGRDAPSYVNDLKPREEASRSIVAATTHSSSRPVALKKPYSGTARIGTVKPKESFEPLGSRTGIPGKGPARLSAPRRRSSVAMSTAKKNPAGIDVTANWKGEPKFRKTRTLPTTNAAHGTDKPFRTFKTLGARNSIQKWRRNEPAPDPTQLVFVDPKTGKVPKPPTPASISPQTPFQKFQEELAAKEAKGLAINERNDLRPDETNDDLLPDAGKPVIEPKISDADGDFSKSPTSPSAKALIESSLYPSTKPPVNAPTGPRASSAHSLQTHHQSSDSSETPAAVMIQQAGVSVETNSLALMACPTKAEKLNLFRRLENTLVIGNFRIGSSLEDVGRMKLAGFDWVVKQRLLTIKDRNNPDALYFDFDKLCSATDYEAYWHNDRYIGSGYVVPYPKSEEKYQSIAACLACHTSVGVFAAEGFTMLIWPAHSSVWGFLENCLPAVPPGTVLRFAVREPLSTNSVSQTEPSVITELSLKDAETYNVIERKVLDNPLQPGEHPINTVFREVFGIEFDRLIASTSQKQPLAKNFFLCFVPANSEQYEPDDGKRQALRCSTIEEHELFVRFLQANGAETIFSMQDLGFHEPVKRGTWRYFIEKMKSGVVIIHESCGRLDQLPYLAKFLSSRGESINVWMTSLLSLEPTEQSHPHLVRCFPHGGAILLTVSLILYHPYEALRVLRWIRLEQLPNKPSGTWKVAVRPRIREWLLDIHDLCCEETWQSPFGDFNLQVYADLNTEVLLLLERNTEPFGLMVETWDTEVPIPEAPVVAEIQLPKSRREWTGNSFATAKIDHDAVRWNDDELIQWFSEWAGAHMWDHRKFHVVLGYEKGDKEGDRLLKCYERGYGYLEDESSKSDRQEQGPSKRSDGTEVGSAWERGLLEILPHDQFSSRTRIPDRAELDQKHADVCQKERDALSRLQTEAEHEWREERDVARDVLAAIMQICRDKGGTEEQARTAGRRHLLWRRDEQGTASDWEVQHCAIDMNWRSPNPYTWISQIVSGNGEEGKAALEEQRREAKRLADKELLSGSQERARMWQDELRMWAAQDIQRGAASSH